MVDLSNLKDATQEEKHQLYLWAKNYIWQYEGFSYDFETNGERLLIDRLMAFDIQTVFDVGANVGSWTNMALKSFPSAKIHSFELSQETSKYLQQNVSDARATLNACGISDKEGEITYKDYGVNSTINTTVLDTDLHDSRFPFTEKKAPLITGDAYCEKNGIARIDLLKIDVEGAEHLVLKGFEKMLSERKIGVVQFEYGYANADTHFLIRDYYNLWGKYGYKMGPLKPTGVLFREFEYGLNQFFSGPNYVAVANDRTDLIHALNGVPIAGYP